MNSSLLPERVTSASSMRWFMITAWGVILVKCAGVWWAIRHWSVPVHPAWIIVPTLLMAALATALWVTHPDD